MQVINGNSNVNHQYFEQNKTKRNSYELIFEQKFNDNSKLSLKNSISNFDRNFLSNNNLLKAKQTNYFSELSYIKNIQKALW
jgi:outer membrane receptor for Fe3+-dicitrate